VDILPVPVAGETRVIDTRVRRRDFGQQVDYRTRPALSGAELDRLENALFCALPGAKALVVSGSAGCEGAARRVCGILRRARAAGVKTVLDANGEALILGMEAAPDLLKPNERELRSLTGSSEPASAAKLIAAGVREVLLSMGEVGCCLFREGLEKYCPAPEVETINPVGSGDSFLAGYLYAVLKGYSDEFSLMIACAAGAANACVFPAARVERGDVEALLGRPI